MVVYSTSLKQDNVCYAGGRQCQNPQKSKSKKQDAGKVPEATRTGMLLLGGVWWCTVPRVNKIIE